MYGFYHPLNVIWEMLIYYPGVLIMMIGIAGFAAVLITEFVRKHTERNEARQRMMYERRETVFYVSPQDKALLRPAQPPSAAPDELLRSVEPASQTLPLQLLRAGAAAGAAANVNQSNAN